MYLQADLSFLPPLKIKPPYYTRKMDMEDDNDMRLWIETVNDAYSEFGEKEISFKDGQNYLSNHLFMNVWDVYFMMNGDEQIGAITIGTYKENKRIGCVSRIAIKSKYKGKGLGKQIIAFAYHHLYENGIKFGQSIIGLKRTASIITHMKCGFYPQFFKKYYVYDNQQRFFFIRLITLIRLLKLYTKYLNHTSKNFLS